MATATTVTLVSSGGAGAQHGGPVVTLGSSGGAQHAKAAPVHLLSVAMDAASHVARREGATMDSDDNWTPVLFDGRYVRSLLRIIPSLPQRAAKQGHNHLALFERLAIVALGMFASCGRACIYLLGQAQKLHSSSCSTLFIDIIVSVCLTQLLIAAFVIVFYRGTLALPTLVNRLERCMALVCHTVCSSWLFAALSSLL
jgi:hypothetical protein